MKNMNNKLAPVAVSLTDLIFDPLNPRLVDIKERPPVIPEARFDEDKIQVVSRRSSSGASSRSISWSITSARTAT